MHPDLNQAQHGTRRSTMTRASPGRRIPLGGAQRDAGEKVLIALEAFTGLTGVAGGVMLMARPDGSLLQMAPSALSALAHNSPFPNFFLPGLLLAGIVGGGMLSAAMLLVQRRPYALETAIAAGAALAIFELVESAAIGFMPLQVVEGVVGLLVLGLAARRWSAVPHPLRNALP